MSLGVIGRIEGLSDQKIGGGSGVVMGVYEVFISSFKRKYGFNLSGDIRLMVPFISTAKYFSVRCLTAYEPKQIDYIDEVTWA